MEWHEILQFVLSGGAITLVAAFGRTFIKLVRWQSSVDSRLDQYRERFDGSGDRKGLFSRLDDIQTQINDARRDGANEHTALREEMHAHASTTDTLVNGLTGEVRELRGELHGGGFLSPRRPVKPPGAGE